MKWVYQVFGISKQAYYQRISRERVQLDFEKKVIEFVSAKRTRQNRIGARKLHLELNAAGISIGRDALFDILRKYGMLVRRTKRAHITTNSNHMFRKYPNKVKDLAITHSEQVFVSDITYIDIEQKHAYLALVTDAYSKNVMGWNLQFHMRACLVTDALRNAMKQMIHNEKSTIHHSDRGIQYCCPEFTTFAESNKFELSNTQNSDPYENAIAERINGILKYEFGLKNTLPSIEVARKMIAEAIDIYNNERLHMSLDYDTPAVAHQQYNKHKIKSYAKKKIKPIIFENDNVRMETSSAEEQLG
jgi:putative transposase